MENKIQIMVEPKEEFNILNSDYVQTIDCQKKKLNFAITALKDISVWCESLHDAKKVAIYCLSEIEKL